MRKIKVVVVVVVLFAVSEIIYMETNVLHSCGSNSCHYNSYLANSAVSRIIMQAETDHFFCNFSQIPFSAMSKPSLSAIICDHMQT